jgi:Spy/CpxP family protein refolding chaperone
MKTKIWIAATVLLALVMCGTALLSYAQDSQAAPTKVWEGHRHGHMAYLARELNLTDAQKEQIKSIMQANRQANLPLMQKLATSKKAMLAATANGAYDQAKVQALASQQAQLMAQLIVQRQAIQHQIYTQVLTPEQRTTADQLRAKQITRIDNRLQKLSQSGTSSPEQ